MKTILFFVYLTIFLCCTSLDKTKHNVVNIIIEDFTLEKLNHCFQRYDSLLLEPTISPYKLGIIIIENNSSDSIWVFTEKKFNTLFYQPQKVTDYDNKGQIIVKRLANVFSNYKTNISPNSSKCFLTYFYSSKVGVYQEFQIDYFKDTTNINMISMTIYR